MHLSVIVPAYNEEKNLATNIKKFNEYLSQQSYDYEIIIVNDGSTDQTKKIAKQLAFEMKNVYSINNKTNQGKGAAVRQGLLESSGKYRLFLDADSATSINHIEKAWPYFKKGYEVVIGSRNERDVPGTRMEIPQPWPKRILGLSGNIAIQALAVRGIWDTQCGFKVLTQRAVKNIIPKTTNNGWAMDIEILILAKLLNYKIAKIPVNWKDGPNSRVKIKDYLSTLKDLIQIKWNLIRNKY